MSHGPYHRLANPRTQSRETSEKQVLTGQIWGRTPRGGREPQVQAYSGPLPEGRSGVEFAAPIPPHYEKMSGEVRWSAVPGSPHVWLDPSGEFAILEVTIIRVRHSDE